MSNIKGESIKSKKISATQKMVTPGLEFSTVYTFATVPAAASNTGLVIVVTDGGAGNLTIARSDGTNWVRCDGSGLNIATS